MEKITEELIENLIEKDLKIEINYVDKKIQDIEIGDYVVSFDIEKDIFRHNQVTYTHLPIVETKDQMKIVSDDTSYNITSIKHPMCFFGGNKWDYKPSGELKVGDVLKSNSGSKIKIKELLYNNDVNIDSQFYDISVNNDNNFLAGNSEKKFVAHNSSSVYFPFWHYEIEDILVLKNNKGTEDNRVRHMDYGIQFCALFYRRFVNNEDLTLFSPHEVPDLYEAFGDNEKFEQLYLKYERKTSIRKKKVKARDLMNQFAQERIGTGRMYVMNIDNVNSNSPFQEKISMSNLCAEINLVTSPINHIDDGIMVKKWIKVEKNKTEEYLEWRKTNKELFIDGNTDTIHSLSKNNLFELFQGMNDLNTEKYDYFEEDFEKVWGEKPAEIALCVLSGVNLGQIKELSELESTCEDIVRSLDFVITHQEYPVESAKKMLKRRSIGVGLTNLAYYFAKNNVSYGSPESLLLLDETMEHIQYYLIKASVKLAQEFGACEYFHKTTYAQGIMPIDRYNKNVDKLIKRKHSLDWKSLRKDVVKYGMRNSTLTAIMPSESSAVIANATNGIEPPRALITIKKSKHGLLKMVVPEIKKLKNRYELAFDIENKDYSNVQSVIQKWIDQGISANHYYSMENGESLSISKVVKDIMYFYKMGGKQIYYANTADGKTDDFTDIINGEKKESEKGVMVEEDESCIGGACSL